MRAPNSLLASVAIVFGFLGTDQAQASSVGAYSAGHADIAVDYSPSNGLSFFYEISGTAVLNGTQVGGAGLSADPSEIAVIVPESVLTTGVAGLPTPFAGQPLYLLRQTSIGSGSRPFLGFGAEEVGSGIFVNDSLTFSLTGFSSSSGGQFVLYTNGSQATPNMNSADGLNGADFIDVFAGGHDHFNLGFTSAGIYNLVLTASGSLVAGGTASSSSTFQFVVGNVSAVPEPSSVVMVGLALGCSGFAALRKRFGRVS